MGKKTDIFAVSFILFFVAGFTALTINDIGLLENQQASAELEEYAIMLEPLKSTLDEVNQKLDTLESDTVVELEKLREEIDAVKTLELEGQNQVLSNSNTPVIESTEIIQNENSNFIINLDKEEYLPGDMIQVSGIANSNTPLSAKLTNPNDKHEFYANSNTANDGSYTLIFILNSDAESGIWNVSVQQNGVQRIVSFPVLAQ
jgi:type II secretory pathway pseudopilin PulG